MATMTIGGSVKQSSKTSAGSSPLAVGQECCARDQNRKWDGSKDPELRPQEYAKLGRIEELVRGPVRFGGGSSMVRRNRGRHVSS